MALIGTGVALMGGLAAFASSSQLDLDLALQRTPASTVEVTTAYDAGRRTAQLSCSPASTMACRVDLVQPGANRTWHIRPGAKVEVADVAPSAKYAVGLQSDAGTDWTPITD